MCYVQLKRRVSAIINCASKTSLRDDRNCPSYKKMGYVDPTFFRFTKLILVFGKSLFYNIPLPSADIC